MPKKYAFIVLSLLLVTAIVIMANPGERRDTISATDDIKMEGRSTRATCSMAKTNGTEATYYSNYRTGMGTYTYLDPGILCSSPTYPFEITDFTVMFNYLYASPINMNIVVYEVASSGLTCDGPGVEKCRYPVTVTAFSPNAFSYTFPTPCCVNGPFFIGMEYTQDFSSRTPSIMFDNNSAPDTCDNWMRLADGTFIEWYDYWGSPVRGYPLFWVNGETESPNCEECTWTEGDPHKMHFPQLPDENGWDVNATYSSLADDWQCPETGWIKDIHFWGSWMHGVEGQIISFDLIIHDNIPANPPDIPFDVPGVPLWEREIPMSRVNVVTNTTAQPTEGWYDPFTGADPEDGEFFESDHDTYYQYNICLDEADWFYQEEGKIYWLEILANIQDPVSTQWGWKSTLNDWINNAVCHNGVDIYLYDEMLSPPQFVSQLNLAFVITGEPTPYYGACCYDPTGGGVDAVCIYTSQTECEQNLGGVYQGNGVPCTASEACCLPNGDCVMADPLCCANQLGGTPQGTGSQCTQPVACCFPDGSCTMLDPECCDDAGGSVSVYSTSCLGDSDGNGTDDGCEEPKGACCLEDGSCQLLTASDCNQLVGNYLGDGTKCLGDINGNGADDVCDPPWQPGDPYKMHYPQLPDLDGWDVWDATVLADDWQCIESGPVTDIHFWGSWKNGIEGTIAGFEIRIYSDIAAAQSPTGYSVPGEMLWTYYTENFIPHLNYGPPEGWYEPTIGLYIPGNHNSYYQYDIYIPQVEAFVQEEGTVYWLAIVAVVNSGPSGPRWGWKSSTNHFNDDAVYGLQSLPVTPDEWIEIYEPPDYQTSLDLAFVITGGIDCDCIPGDANNDGTINVGDAVYIIAYVFKGGPPPVPYPICNGDANCDCQCNVGDAVYLISYVFKGGPGPCDCPTWLSNCGSPLRK